MPPPADEEAEPSDDRDEDLAPVVAAATAGKQRKSRRAKRADRTRDSGEQEPPRSRREGRPAAAGADKPRGTSRGVLAAGVLAVIALVVFLVAGGDSEPEQTAQTPTTPAPATPPESQPAPSDEESGAQGQGEETGGGNGQQAGGGGGGGNQGGAAGERPIVLGGAVAADLPAGWKQIGVSGDGGANLAPDDKSVLVAVYFESGAGLTLEDFTDRAQEFVGGRRAGAQPEQAKFYGSESGFESPYANGREYVRVVIDGKTQILAIASITDGATKDRRAEALAVLDSVSAR